MLCIAVKMGIACSIQGTGEASSAHGSYAELLLVLLVFPCIEQGVEQQDKPGPAPAAHG